MEAVLIGMLPLVLNRGAGGWEVLWRGSVDELKEEGFAPVGSFLPFRVLNLVRTLHV
jgi:hypothetical protein